MDEFTPALVVTVIGSALALFQAARFSRRERSLLLASFFAHVLSAFAQVQVTRGLYAGVGDMLGFVRGGGLIARILRMDFYQFAPELLNLAIRPPAHLPFDVSRWAGTSTGAMMAIGGILSYLTWGGAYTLCIAVAVWAYFGQVALYRAFRDAFPAAFQGRLLIATLLVPSCVFWASALLKESVAIGGMGFAVLGFVRIRKAFRISALAQIAAGAVVVALVKAYILFALILAAGAWVYCERARGPARTSAFGRVVVGAVVAVGGIALLTLVFPEFGIGTFAERAATYQSNTELVEGGSNYAIGDTTQRTLAGQLPFAPLALGTALFRPFLFEVQSPQAAVSALETTVLLFLAIRALTRRSLRETWRIVSGVPLLAFSLTFTVFLGLGVGFTTTNMGTLSRYRMPLVPFFTALILVLDSPFLSRTPPVLAAPRGPLRLRRPFGRNDAIGEWASTHERRTGPG